MKYLLLMGLLALPIVGSCEETAVPENHPCHALKVIVTGGVNAKVSSSGTPEPQTSPATVGVCEDPWIRVGAGDYYVTEKEMLEQRKIVSLN